VGDIATLGLLLYGNSKVASSASAAAWPSRGTVETRQTSKREWLAANGVVSADVVRRSCQVAEAALRSWTPVFIHPDRFLDACGCHACRRPVLTVRSAARNDRSPYTPMATGVSSGGCGTLATRNATAFPATPVSTSSLLALVYIRRMLRYRLISGIEEADSAAKPRHPTAATTVVQVPITRMAWPATGAAGVGVGPTR
jgi:hypothetical protein